MNWNNQTKFAVVFTLVMVLATVFFTSQQAKSSTIEDMQVVCSISHEMNNGTLEQTCGNLIYNLDKQGYEVLYKGNHFWAEKYQ